MSTIKANKTLVATNKINGFLYAYFICVCICINVILILNKYFLNLNPDDMLLLPGDKGHILISQFTPTAASLFEHLGSPV